MKFVSNLNDFHEKHGGKGSSFVRNLARAVNVTPRTIHLILEGSEPKLELAVAIAKEMGLSLAEMIGDEKPAFAPPRELTPAERAQIALEGLKVTPKQKELIALILAADPEHLDSDTVDIIRDALLPLEEDDIPPPSEKPLSPKLKRSKRS